MAIAQTPTLLPLDTFARIMGYNPLGFNQVDVPGLLSAQSPCPGVILQYAWQRADATGRDELAQVIADAEEAITRELHFSPGPTWANAEFLVYPKPANPASLFGRVWQPDGRWAGLTASHYFIEGGQETKDLILAGAPVIYTDTDGDGYFETATITATLVDAATKASEVAVYYPGTSDDGFEIRPTSVSIASGVATIKARREQCVDLDLLEALDASGVNGHDDTAFLGTVDVFRHWTNPATQVQLRWEGSIPGWLGQLCTCNGTGVCVACSFITQSGCISARNPKLGQIYITPGTYDSTSGSYTQAIWTGLRSPDGVLLWYKHGLTDDSGSMPTEWQRAISYLAASKLDRPLQDCQQLENVARYWSEDLALVNGQNNSRFQVTQRVLDNPLGTTRADVYVWRMIQKTKHGEAVANL